MIAACARGTDPLPPQQWGGPAPQPVFVKGPQAAPHRAHEARDSSDQAQD